MAKYHLAQVNIGRVKTAPDDPRMAGFMARLDELNVLADHSPGFVWRLQTNEGNATYFRRYPHDDRILMNMSVWESIESLRHYVYKTVHAELLRQRHEWFEKFAGAYMVLWWVPIGHRPGIDEMKHALLIWINTDPRNTPSISKPLFSRMTNSSRELTGRRLRRALQCSLGPRQPRSHDT